MIEMNPGLLAALTAALVILGVVAAVLLRGSSASSEPSDALQDHASPSGQLGPAQAPAKPSRLLQALSKTREQLLGALGVGAGLTSETRSALEDALIRADVGVTTARALLDELAHNLPPDAGQDQILETLQAGVLEQLLSLEGGLNEAPQGPTVTLVVGVNGAGKTTTIGKLAARLQGQGKSVLLAAGDTYRAGAIEQLRAWSQRVGTEFVANEPGSDAAAVVYQGSEAAKARGIDVVLADTAGRLHTSRDLMAELVKVRKVAGKVVEGAPHNVLLVLDGTMGQNALTQAREFHDSVGITHLAVTKLDGTARGGVLLAIAAELGLPVPYIGVGEATEDLQAFEAKAYARALVAGSAE